VRSSLYRLGLLVPAGLLTAGAAAIHFSLVPDHLSEYLPFGILFVVTGLAQAALALATVLWPRRRVFAAAALVALGCITVWLVSRTVGLPFGPSERLAIDTSAPVSIFLEIATSNGQLAGTLTSIIEAASVLLFAVLLVMPPRPRPVRRWWLAGSIPSGLLIVLLSFIGVSAGSFNALPESVNMSTASRASATLSMDQLVEPRGSQPIKTFDLTTKIVTIKGQVAWTFNGTVPGPEIRANVGDRILVHLLNNLPAATSIHWHGLRLPNAEDGVAGITQDAVASGTSYTYEFVVKDPGTYWYHAHQDTEHQVPRGLYGALVVEPTSGPSYDEDFSLAIGDASELLPPTRFDAKPGDLVRLRIISAYQEDMTGTPELLVLAGARYKVVALDGHDLNQPQELGPELLPIGTGQRYDLVFRMPQSGQVLLLDRRPQTGSRQIRREWASLGSGPAPDSPTGEKLNTFDLATYGQPTSDPVASRSSFNVSADLHIASFPGVRYGSYQFIHTFNGKSFPDTSPIIVDEGDYVRLRFINETNEYHPIHLHGHFMHVISRNGVPISGSPVVLDSILVGPNQTWEVALLADNPGLWMIHCHVLIHAAYGLSTMLSYRGIWTPYVIGTKSGNFPE
jgi:FtsP/CotA-like multicopper oxidase with cupredoxin domain